MSSFEPPDHPRTALPPLCPKCHAIIRPRVVLFDEMLPSLALRQLGVIRTESPPDLVVVIGTTGVFHYIESPVQLARQRGVPTIEINPELTALSHLVQYRMNRRAAEALIDLWEASGLDPGAGSHLSPLNG